MSASGASGGADGSSVPPTTDRPAQKRQRQEGARSKGKGKDGKDKKRTVNMEEEDETMDDQDHLYMMRLSKLSLNTAQRTRELEGAVYTAVNMETKSAVAKALKEAGVHYNELVQNNPGHGAGPPHILVWVALVEAVQAQDLQALAPDHKETLSKYQAKLDKQEQHEALEETTSCKYKENYIRDDTEPTSRLHFTTSASVQTEQGTTVLVRPAMLAALKVIGAKVHSGAPPPGNLERLVGKAVGRAGRK